MNKKLLDKLKFQAAAQVSPLLEGSEWQQVYSEKFAELIVRECFGCIDIMEKIAHSTNASIPKDYDKHTYLETLDTVRGLFKTHFGVEE